jgi:hypothetical protein
LTGFTTLFCCQRLLAVRSAPITAVDSHLIVAGHLVIDAGGSGLLGIQPTSNIEYTSKRLVLSEPVTIRLLCMQLSSWSCHTSSLALSFLDVSYDVTAAYR